MAALGLFMSLGASAQQNWFPSKWGPNDELGAANYLTPQLAADAAKLVKTGKTYSLGITVNTTTPA
ncbi:MAG: polyketide cyclase, partial [Burkholderiales bacterium PBB5]